MVKRGDIWLVALDPTRGSEIKKSRPCVVISPAEMHDHLCSVIVAPMTTGRQPAAFRVPIQFAGKKGLIFLDQLRTVDKTRFVKKLGVATPRTIAAVLATLQEIFVE
jgi:mRNA interferase MazF